MDGSEERGAGVVFRRCFWRVRVVDGVGSDVLFTLLSSSTACRDASTLGVVVSCVVCVSGRRCDGRQ